MKHIKIYEEWGYKDIPVEVKDMFELTEKIPLGSDFYIEGPKGGIDKDLLSDIKWEITKLEPRHNYYYQDLNAVDVVFNQRKMLEEKYGEKLRDLDFYIIPCVLGYFGHGTYRTDKVGPDEIPFWVGDKVIGIQKEGKTKEDIQESVKEVARENGVTHIGRVGTRIPVEEWTGDPY